MVLKSKYLKIRKGFGTKIVLVSLTNDFASCRVSSIGREVGNSADIHH